ncbi:MAG: hypothetical protein HFH70_14180 [Lachnospiraceae bacterium]|nr:hypothetical protein [Lachnospiraceae bacterium]
MLTIREIRYVLLLVATWNIAIIIFVCVSQKVTMEKNIIDSAVEGVLASEKKKMGKSDKENIKLNIVSRQKTNDVDSSMTDMYASLLIGDYSLGNGIKYKFSSNGSFSGYFDDEHTDVKGYYYEVVLIGGNNVVNIYSKDKTSVVSYYIVLSEEADIILYYPETDIRFTLEI